MPARKLIGEPVQAGVRRLAFRHRRGNPVVSLAFKVPSIHADADGHIARDAETEDAWP